MENKDYRPRVADAALSLYLKTFGAVCVEGPKWCGKTWTSARHSGSVCSLADPRGNFQNRRMAEMDPALVLEGERPRLLDEWQEVPSLWDAVRFGVDDAAGRHGQFVLTGSATPVTKGVLHSGAGRIARLRMHTMSLYESGDSSGDVSLQSLFGKGFAKNKPTGPVKLERLAELIVRGGWPAALGMPLNRAMLLPREYIRAVVSDDMNRLDGVRRDTAKMQLLLRSLARNECTLTTVRKLVSDISAVDAQDIDIKTVNGYLDVLRRLFLLENQPPFGFGLRSSVRVKQAEKWHFADPSLAAALLGATPKRLMGDLNTLGFLFESLVERDLRVYAESFNAKLYHYRDYRDREIDAVVELPDSTWGAIEIKLGANQIDAAAAGLLKLRAALVAESPANAPAFLCVICGLCDAAYRRPDGVYVVPITALRP